MPHYDESFIHDDNINQKRNKRSYHVYKTGANPRAQLENTEVLYDPEDRSKTAIKRNIKNIKHRGNRYKPELQCATQFPIRVKYKTPDIIVDHYPRISVFDPNKYYDLRNNNISPLTPCKSFDNLTLKNGRKKETNKGKFRIGASLQNLVDDSNLKHYVSPHEDRLYASRKDEVKNSYSVVDARSRQMLRRGSQVTPAPGVGIYRQISNEGICRKPTPGTILINLTNIVFHSLTQCCIFKGLGNFSFSVSNS